MQEKFIVNLGGYWYWPDYWLNFYSHCRTIALANNWDILSVINRQLKPHGRWCTPKTYDPYLRWDDEKYHTLFVLRWS